jgi:hypothetical protein
MRRFTTTETTTATITNGSVVALGGGYTTPCDTACSITTVCIHSTVMPALCTVTTTLFNYQRTRGYKDTWIDRYYSKIYTRRRDRGQGMKRILK